MDGSGPGIPEPGTLVDDAAAAFAAELTGRSGKAPVTGAALAHATGRPRPLPARAVLTALLCLAPGGRPLLITEATRLLSGQLCGASRALPGITATIPAQRAFLAACRRVRYCFGQILNVAGPSALPKNRRLSEDGRKARTQPMTPGQAQAARARLEALVNALPGASITVLTAGERAGLDGCTGLDATPAPLFSRGPSRRTGLPASDPDGGWHVREGDHREREDNNGKPLRKSAGRWKPPPPPPHGPPARRPQRRTSRSAWPSPGPARTPAAPAPRSWPPPPPAATSPAPRATTAPIPRRSPSASTSRPGRWATPRSWTTAPASPASRQTPAAPYSRREPGTAPPCPSR
jgi:hypothetical protein